MQISKKKLLFLSFLILITSSWFFYLINNKDPFSVKTVVFEKALFKEPQLKDRIHSYLNQCTPHWPLLVCRTVYNKPVFLISTLSINFINHFSPETLFVKGASSPFPIFFFPFFYWGLFKALIDYKKHKVLLFLLFLYAFIPSFFYGFDYRVSILGSFILPVVIAYGFWKIYEKLSSKNSWIVKLGIVLLIFLLFQHLVEMYIFYYSM